MNLSVEVYPFAVPVRSPLPLAVTFAPHDHPTAESQAQQAAWRQTADYPINAWRQQRLAWGDFLADYYLTYDSLYGTQGWAPDFEILQRLHERGQLGMFNLGYYGILGDTPEAVDAWKKDTLARIKDAYDKAKSLGLLDHAYIYGCDEHPADQFPGVERAAAEFKQACPGVLVMTTTYDHSFGTDFGDQVHGCLLPAHASVRSALAAQARAAGKQVWWYICCGPHHPHANMFIEYPAIDGRVLMGAQTAKYRPDGFLYYQISIWNSQRPITAGPFTDWDPRSWTTYHGDGSWTCVGPGGSPLATIRLENFRDGLEDYAYVRILESLVAQVESLANRSAQQDAWLPQARQALAVPEELVKSLTEYHVRPRRGLPMARATGAGHPGCGHLAPRSMVTVSRYLTEKKHELQNSESRIYRNQGAPHDPLPDPAGRCSRFLPGGPDIRCRSAAGTHGLLQAERQFRRFHGEVRGRL